MKKILVILTGGTIGSRIDSNIIDVSPEAAYNLITLYNQQYNNDTDFEVIQPLNTLSENMTPKHWSTISNAIAEVDFSKYSGVIIAHGTDTLSYTSALIGMLFHDAPIPIVIIASNYALGEKGSNGLDNFRSAVCFIKESPCLGVFTIFQNNKGSNEVYISTRIMESDCYSDQFSSFGGKAYGCIVNSHFNSYEAPYNPSFQELNSTEKNTFNFPLSFTNDILFIRPYPGLNYSYFDLSKKPKAVIHYLYHSATSCTKGCEYSLLEFIKRCKESGIDFYVASFKSHHAAMYATSKKILDMGAIPLINISPEAAYAKLLILYNTSCDIKASLYKNLYFECLPPR